MSTVSADLHSTPAVSASSAPKAIWSPVVSIVVRLGHFLVNASEKVYEARKKEIGKNMTFYI